MIQHNDKRGKTQVLITNCKAQTVQCIECIECIQCIHCMQCTQLALALVANNGFQHGKARNLPCVSPVCLKMIENVVLGLRCYHIYIYILAKYVLTCGRSFICIGYMSYIPCTFWYFQNGYFGTRALPPSLSTKLRLPRLSGRGC